MAATSFVTKPKFVNKTIPFFSKPLRYSFAMTVALILVLLTTSTGFALPGYSLTRVTIKLTPEFSNRVVRLVDGTISLPTGSTELDVILRERKADQLTPFFSFDPISLKNPEFTRLGMNRFYKIVFELTDERDIRQLVQRLEKIDVIELAEVIPLAFADLTPNDWGLSSRNMWFLDSVHARQAWDNQTGSSSILAITIDTGVNYNHEDLTGNIGTNTAEDINGDGLFTAADNNGVDNDGNGFVDDVIGWDFVSHSYTEISGGSAASGEDYGPRDNTPADVHGHGTHVCGSIAGVTNNSLGVPAVSYNVRTRALRAGFAWLYGSTLYGSGYDDDFAPAIQYSVNLGARIISISFGGSSSSTAYQTAVTYARNNNCLVLASAGNSNSSTIQYPGGYTGVMAVAALDRGNVKADFSNYGSWVDISAPGVDIWSTMVVNTYNPNPYVAWDGTSMATPTAASVAALALSRNSGLTDDQLETQLLSTATSIATQNPSYIGMLGSGIVNAQTLINGISPSGITVIAPNGGENFLLESTATIQWTANSSITNVKIELNRSYPSATWETLIASTTNDGSHSWTVSGASTATARVRISNAVNAAVADTSNANFSIYAVKVLSPNGGEVLTIGATTPITWSAATSYTNVKIELNRSYPSASWETIALSTPNTGSYNWLINGAASTTSRIRISNAANLSIADTSDADFYLFTLPTTMQEYFNTSVPPANWTNLGDWDLFAYSGNNSARLNYYDINSIGTRDSMFTSQLNLSGYGTATLRFSTSYALYSGYYDSLIVAARIGTGAWTSLWRQGGSTLSNRTGRNPTTFRTNSINLAAQYLASNVQFAFIGYNGYGDNLYLDSVLVSGTVSRSITVTSPNGGENWIVGTTHPITWTSQNLTGNVHIVIDRNYPSGTWTGLFNNIPNDGSENWTITGAASAAARIRILSVDDLSIGDTCNANFTLTQPTITLTRPNSGESLYTGKTDTIRWTSTNLSGNVSIFLNRDYPAGSWDSLTTVAYTATPYLWTPSGASTINARFRIVSVTYPSVADTSNANFSVTASQNALTYPHGGETFLMDAVDTIRWSTNLPGNVTVKWTRNYPVGSWYTIGTLLGSTGKLGWTVPDSATTTARFAVIPAYLPTLADTSNANSTIIHPTVTFTHPNGGETLYIGRSDTIRWTANFSATVVVAYCSNGADINSAEVIPGGDSVAVSQGWFVWTPQLPLTTRGRICLVEWGNSREHWSAADFSIVTPQFTFQHPNGGETLYSGISDTIRWTTNIQGTATIAYSSNGVNLNDAVVLAGGDSVSLSRGWFAWTPEIPTTTHGRVCIIEWNTGIAHWSNGDFTVLTPQLSITHPNDGETLYIGVPDTIRWTTNLTGAVTIAYSPQGADISHAAALAGGDSIPLSQGWFAWTPELPATTHGRICLVEWSNGMEHWSGSDFTVANRTITLLRPNGGEDFVHGSTDTIRWDAVGVNGNLQIDVNRNYPTGAWEPLATVAASASPWLWNVTGALTSNARIRISMVDVPLVSDISNASFRIVTTIPPAAPGGVTATLMGSSVRISWNRVDTTTTGLAVTVTGYQILAGSSLNNMTVIATTNHRDSTSWIDSEVLGVSSMKLYRVVAVSNGALDTTTPPLDEILPITIRLEQPTPSPVDSRKQK
ncbi:MAG: S8 family serine peptidase [bacterium]|nr:S8 family serine peptidase [bacterium]